MFSGTILQLLNAELMLMTLTEFISLNHEQRYETWLTQSIQVGKRENGFFQHYLYRLDDFYIELRMFSLFPDQAKMYVITDESLIDPYLDQINLGELGFA